MNGANPDLYALRSPWRGAASDLYRAEGDLGIVAMYGRWKGATIHAYLWQSRSTAHGIASLMNAIGGHIIHLAEGALGNQVGNAPSVGYIAKTKWGDRLNN